MSQRLSPISRPIFIRRLRNLGFEGPIAGGSTLEDFLLFVNREKLYTGFKPKWKREVLRSLRQWENIQATSTVKKYPEIAVGVLQQLGYIVSPPRDGPT